MKKKQKKRKNNSQQIETISIANSYPTFCVSLLKNGKTSKCEFKGEKIKNAEISWINIQSYDLINEAPKIAMSLNFNPHLIQELLSQHLSGYVDHDIELGLLVPAVRVKELDVEANKLLILIKKNMIVTIHGEQVTRLVKFARYSETFLKKIPKNISDIDKLTLVLIRIIEENNERNFEGIRSIQEQGEHISKYLIEPTDIKKELGADIYKMKHALISYLEALWASKEVIQYLREGDADLITDDPNILQKINMLNIEITKQISLSEQMSTVLASGLEVLQSIYNNQLQMLNNRLAVVVTWLTILGTAVLVPNTIATIFGVAPIAEHMEWHLILWIIILSTVFAVFIVYFFVRKKGLLPEKIEP